MCQPLFLKKDFRDLKADRLCGGLGCTDTSGAWIEWSQELPSAQFPTKKINSFLFRCHMASLLIAALLQNRAGCEKDKWTRSWRGKKWGEATDTGSPKFQRQSQSELSYSPFSFSTQVATLSYTLTRIHIHTFSFRFLSPSLLCIDLAVTTVLFYLCNQWSHKWLSQSILQV